MIRLNIKTHNLVKVKSFRTLSNFAFLWISSGISMFMFTILRTKLAKLYNLLIDL